MGRERGEREEEGLEEWQGEGREGEGRKKGEERKEREERRRGGRGKWEKEREVKTVNCSKFQERASFFSP